MVKPGSWTREQGLDFCRRVEERISPLQWHCAMGGSVMYNGYSENDLDIIMYRHDKDNVKDPDPPDIDSITGAIADLTQSGFRELFTYDPNREPLVRYKRVFVGYIPVSNQVINLFFPQ